LKSRWSNNYSKRLISNRMIKISNSMNKMIEWEMSLMKANIRRLRIIMKYKNNI